MKPARRQVVLNKGAEKYLKSIDSYEPNGYGLYNMSGNVAEWCQDKWNPHYEGAPTDGSAWETSESTFRVKRGGGWQSHARWLSVTRRNRDTLFGSTTVGFRCARVQKSEAKGER